MQSLTIGNEEDDDDLKDLDNFLAEESRGSGPRRKGSRHAPLGGLATIVGSPGAGMTQVSLEFQEPMTFQPLLMCASRNRCGADGTAASTAWTVPTDTLESFLYLFSNVIIS